MLITLYNVVEILNKFSLSVNRNILVILTSWYVAHHEYVWLQLYVGTAYFICNTNQRGTPPCLYNDVILRSLVSICLVLIIPDSNWQYRIYCNASSFLTSNSDYTAYIVFYEINYIANYASYRKWYKPGTTASRTILTSVIRAKTGSPMVVKPVPVVLLTRYNPLEILQYYMYE
jgi:hypothetical protein